VKLDEFVPTRFVKVPAAPSYHSKRNGAVPLTTTFKVVASPLVIAIEDGWVIIRGAAFMVTVAPLELTVPDALLILTQ
jgi:hypothetical protein